MVREEFEVTMMRRELCGDRYRAGLSRPAAARALSPDKFVAFDYLRSLPQERLRDFARRTRATGVVAGTAQQARVQRGI